MMCGQYVTLDANMGKLSDLEHVIGDRIAWNSSECELE